ncbi:uncharacterized protein METZ01_LOCUS70243 [marine metagenome]|uniref:Uncharacterized protein n=1 Tax=marine metagenome TaxID=408172 RepID=A0A381TNJ3_9ZZZZ
MDQALGLLTLLGRGPGIAVLPGAARRAFATINQIHSPSTQLVFWPCLLKFFIALRIPDLDFEKNHGMVNALTESCTSSTSARHPKALSTSFEKTCMRQIHCPDRLIAMVNKGPYHAQGLFKLKRTQSRTEAYL